IAARGSSSAGCSAHRKPWRVEFRAAWGARTVGRPGRNTIKADRNKIQAGRNKIKTPAQQKQNPAQQKPNGLSAIKHLPSQWVSGLRPSEAALVRRAASGRSNF